MYDNNRKDNLLVEIAWEVCNQVGGIYTVIRTKVPAMKEKWGENYCLVGPYVHSRLPAEFEPCDDYDSPFGKAVEKLREMGVEVHFGYWLVSGRPLVVLINPQSIHHRMAEAKYMLWEHHSISTNEGDQLMDQIIAFGFLTKLFLTELVKPETTQKHVIAHFHEWMVGTAIPELRYENRNISIVFTTHATILGRYLAMNDPNFYEHLPYFDWLNEARNFNIEATARIERAAAHGAHVFTTVSEVTARECESLLGRRPDVILPNGLNIERFTALHEFQNLHKDYKDKIHQFVMGHFFQSYSFDLDKTLYFFTSGRYEYKNKGFDMTLEALARLNWRMKSENIDTTIVMFFITKQPYHSINPGVIHSRAQMQEIRRTCDEITKIVAEKFFYSTASNPGAKQHDLNKFVDEYWALRLKRELQSWKTNNLPSVVTHNLQNDAGDDILNYLRSSNLINHQHDKVKIVYHPDFIAPSNPLFAMEYGQFVRGCHLGVFPSYYEPWGYTPLECIASGVPTATSDLAGFGEYVMQTIPDHEKKGIYVVDRKSKSYNDAVEQLADQLYSFIKLNRKDRITQRNRVERTAEAFDWQNLIVHYERAYEIALRNRK